MRGDAVEFLSANIADNSLARFQLFFPDPWHKKKHHKRRIVQQDFLNLLAKKLKIGSVCHMATDWQDYAQQMMEMLSHNHPTTQLILFLVKGLICQSVLQNFGFFVN
jgi:tRNA (guanine-N(7)-)-methyltransferase